MELLLWRWSTSVQVASLAMIAVFFWRLSRAIRTPALRWWVGAWLADLVALGITLFFWFRQPSPFVLRFVVAPVYMGAKTAFVVLLIQGAWTARRPAVATLPPRVLAAAILAYAAAVPVFVTEVNQVGVVQHTVMAALLGGAGAILLVGRDPGLPWLAFGMALRGALSLAEAVAYGISLAGPDLAGPRLAGSTGTFLSAASSFDSGAEWLLALGCVLAVSERVQRELLQSNADLLVAQEDLRRMADRDALTGLANRRALPEVLRAVQPGGATLLFFDLDGFKEINDRLGHAAGDETLRRFATGLRESFRPSDALVRYAGDEFVVVAGGLDAGAAAQRAEGLRERLRRPGNGAPPIAFSVGISVLPPGGHPESALRGADEAMYAAKRGAHVAATGR